MGLFELPHDVAPILSALLDTGDLLALTGVCSTARRSLFLSISDARTTALVLPPHDQDRARTFLHGVDPVRLPRFQWIQIATPWHVDLLVECGLVYSVHSIRVVTIDDKNPAIMALMCEKLPLLTHVTKLSVTHTVLEVVTLLSQMTQLRELNLSHTHVVDVSRLSALTELQSLTMEATKVIDLSCVQHFHALEILKVSANVRQSQLGYLANAKNLRTLDLSRCVIKDVRELLAVTTTLEDLRLDAIRVDSSELPHIQQLVQDSHRLEDKNELVHNLAQLQVVSIRGQYMRGRLSRFDEEPQRGSRLDVSCFAIGDGGSIDALYTLPQLEELHLTLRNRHQGGEEMFSGLLRLPRLTRLTVELRSWIFLNGDPHPDDNTFARQVRALGAVLRQLSGLKSLTTNRCIGPASNFASLSNLEHLQFAGGPDPYLTSFEWIGSLHRLRTYWSWQSRGAQHVTVIVCEAARK